MATLTNLRSSAPILDVQTKAIGPTESSWKSRKKRDTKVTSRQKRAGSKHNNEVEHASEYNSVDEILDEANAILQCAHEAQSLGWLKEAHTYLILAHGRLVGLGRLIEQRDVDIGMYGCLKKDNETGTTAQASSYTAQSATHALKRIETPHASQLSQMPKVTPSPASTSQLQTLEETNNLSGNVARWSQELLYRQKGIGNKHANYVRRKEHSQRLRKIRAASFDSKEISCYNTKVDTENLCISGEVQIMKRMRDSLDASISTWDASVMTANFTCLDAKSWLKKSSLPRTKK